MHPNTASSARKKKKVRFSQLLLTYFTLKSLGTNHLWTGGRNVLIPPDKSKASPKASPNFRRGQLPSNDPCCKAHVSHWGGYKAWKAQRCWRGAISPLHSTTQSLLINWRLGRAVPSSPILQNAQYCGSDPANIQVKQLPHATGAVQWWPPW